MIRDSICPVCNGSGQGTDTKYCSNCGPKGMFMGPPDGKTTAKPDGTPCVHNFVEKKVSRCYYRYTCEHCNYVFHIDSGD